MTQPPAPPPPPGRRRRRRRRLPTVRSLWMWVILAVVGAGLVLWLVASVAPREAVEAPAPSPAPSAPASQDTLLLQVRNDSDFGADNMIAAIGADLPVAQVLVPSRMIVDDPGSGQQSLGQTARLLNRMASQDTLSDLLAVRVDGTLSLARLAMAGMVDFVGGISVEVDRAIVDTDPRSGEQTVEVPAGPQSLDGTQAAAYALAWLPGEPESARLARFATVLGSTISALPDDQLRIEQMLTGLGGSARTTVPTADVAAFLRQMRGELLAGSARVQVLPTTEATSSLAAVRVELGAAEALVDELLPEARLDSALASPRVLVRNGAGEVGLGSQARDRLVRAGMVYINGGNAEDLGVRRTAILLPDATAASRELGEEIVAALDVPEEALSVADDGAMVADAEVVLGADFSP